MSWTLKPWLKKGGALRAEVLLYAYVLDMKLIYFLFFSLYPDFNKSNQLSGQFQIVSDSTSQSEITDFKSKSKPEVLMVSGIP
jgi:hypothetical protein